MLYDVAIIGAGVIGTMLARELCKYQLSVIVLEKAQDVACGASHANSGIIHGGYDPEPGTLKAQLNTAGVELLFAAARELNVPHKRNGSLVCAFSQAENQALEQLYDRGSQNHIPGLALLSGEEARALEPQLSANVTGALHVPSAGIICPYSLTVAAIGNAMDNGAQLTCNFPVSAIEKTDVFTVTAEDGRQVRSRFLVNCAGGYSDAVARMAGDDCFTVISRAGEYMLLDKAEGGRVSHTIFQVPTKEGKGILVTPTAHGNLLIGPTARVVATPDSRDTTPEGLATVKALSAKSVPGIDYRQVITSFTGVRASEARGEFILQPSQVLPGLIHAGAIDSPGLTCCVSIAQYLVQLLANAGLALVENPAFDPHRADPHAFLQMSLEEKDRYIREHPAYGKIVCRCETVTEGEILAAIRTNPPARDLDGIKRRTRSGMGRCQGGFCGPYIMELLSKELGIPMDQVTKAGPGSHMLTQKEGQP